MTGSGNNMKLGIIVGSGCMHFLGMNHRNKIILLTMEKADGDCCGAYIFYGAHFSEGIAVK